MLIGIDLDHTIIDYADAFNGLAKNWQLIPLEFEGNKVQLRDYLKEQGQHDQWMRLQGQVYGKEIGRACLMAGFVAFIKQCRVVNIETVVISHKTLYGHFDDEKINLRSAALEWLSNQGFFKELSFQASQVYFEASQEEKIARIRLLGCTHFVDDLLAIFTHSHFPVSLNQYWLSDVPNSKAPKSVNRCSNWKEVSMRIFGA